MNLSEIRKVISESPSKDFFNSLEIQVSFPRTGILRKFKGISALFEYLENQTKGFEKLDVELPEEFIAADKLFENLKKRIEKYLESYNTSNDPTTLVSGWNQQVGRYLSNDQQVFEYDSPNSIFLLDLFQNRRNNYRGAHAYLTSSISSGGINDRDYFNGLILAYEHFQKNETEIKKRRDNEKSSLSKFRSHIDEYISKAEKDFIDFSASLKGKTDSTIDEVTSYKTEKSKEYEKWFGDTSSAFSEFDKASKKKITDLENLYHEKLKLEAPAQYWNKRARALKVEGRWWLAGLILSIVAGVLIFMTALNWLADGVLADIFNDTASAIKWSVIFITLVSFLAFLIKTLSKMAFSTFHLSRDAEEREQLTYVFLAMQKDKAIDPTERHLIMQSLFSRADTGLLKDEGSPTMPGNIFDKVTASANGK